MFAQTSLITVSSGSSVTISSDSQINVGGVSLAPSFDYTITETELSKSNTAATLGTKESISRVYAFSIPQPNFSGTIEFRYEDTELNGNTGEALAVFSRPDSSVSEWIEHVGSVNATENLVAEVALADVTLGEITAATSGTLTVKPITSVFEILLYPNPVQSHLEIKCEGELKSVLYSVTGAKLFETTAKRIDMNSFPKGVYFINVTKRNNQQTNTFKIIKNNQK
ncbi:hypothetical protein BST83_00530 [Polaribacter filamentus]|uniref:Secretion system C-terminal sorting domain-containing protein n=1 Tax=Polaribacter filamentus TaxID=53483 RepID=A0A2S7L1Z2_9FLAO|nr:hypothetical protein BST83_00530 [Polaribacter filamentus]